MPAISSVETRRSRENTRAKLVAAAEGVFAEKGVRRVTVDDLVAAAGFTRGAFYSNFSTIEEVFFSLFEQRSQEMLDTVRTAIDAIPPGEFSLDSLKQVLESLRPLGARWYVIHTEFTLFALRSEQARAVVAEHREMFEGQMNAVIEDVLTRLDRRPTVPLEQVTEVAIALYQHSLAQEGLGLGGLSIGQLTDVVLPQVLLGLSQPQPARRRSR